ncbi:MAG: NAD-dependent epimerase/dehydratase family protein [Hydrogenovibrio crunogenus]|nr:NAD-dependent epimerase/dehydratase family protein [Hydrogenovibrio crunogenus]
MSVIFVTGASGFVGRDLVAQFVEMGLSVKALVRQRSDVLPVDVEQVLLDLANLSTGLKDEASFDFVQDDRENLIQADRVEPVEEPLARLAMTLKQVEVVVHAAARAHIMRDEVADPLAEYRKLNRDATIALARMAADAGVKRFVFVSSIKVNGEITRPGQFFQAEIQQPPVDPYGLSKYEAEQGLLALAKETGMEVVIIRPSLVYGSGVKGNFASMVNWVKKGIPLPLGSVHNLRSLVALDNLVDFIALCADREKSPRAANEVFLISDGQDVSTTELLRKVAKSQNKQAWLIPIPVWLMNFSAKMLGKGAVADRLFGNLQVDSSKARDLLDWKPVVTMDEQLAKMAVADKSK